MLLLLFTSPNISSLTMIMTSLVSTNHSAAESSGSLPTLRGTAAVAVGRSGGGGATTLCVEQTGRRGNEDASASVGRRERERENKLCVTAVTYYCQGRRIYVVVGRGIHECSAVLSHTTRNRVNSVVLSENRGVMQFLH